MEEETYIPISNVMQLTDDYYNSDAPMKATVKYVMGLRRTLREKVLSADKSEVPVLMEQYWKDLYDVYVMERDMANLAKTLTENYNIKVGTSYLYHYLQRTKLLSSMERVDMYLNRLPWNNMDFVEFFKTWWNVLFIELKEDPRVVYKDKVKFVNITADTIIEETNYMGTKKKSGCEIIRRNAEVFSGEEDEAGTVVVYIYVQDNPGTEIRTRTVFCFAIPEEMKRPEIRVFPVILNVE